MVVCQASLDIPHCINIIFYMSDRPSKKEKVLKLKKDAPSVPLMTCPNFEHALGLLDSMQKYVDTEQIDCYEATDKLLRSYLENLRFANSQLRESGRYWYQASCDLLTLDDIYEDDRFG